MPKCCKVQLVLNKLRNILSIIVRSVEWNIILFYVNNVSICPNMKDTHFREHKLKVVAVIVVMIQSGRKKDFAKGINIAIPH